MPRLVPILLLVLPLFLAPALDVAAHSPEDSYSARADLRIDEQRGLRVRTWFEVPESAKLAQGDADAAVSALGGCLDLSLGDEALVGSWRAGDDPKHGLSNGSHRLFALEFEPNRVFTSAATSAKLEVRLVVVCFPEKDLSFSATARARSPWRVESETLPEKAAHHHEHGAGEADDALDLQSRTARIVFTRQSI